MHRRLLVALVVVLIAVPVFANHSWGGYHWARQSNPFTVKVYDNVTSNWDPYLAEAVSDWNASPVFDFQVFWSSPLTSAKRCASATGVIEVCNSKYGATGWLGIAGISITGGEHITKAYTKLNDTYFNTATYNTPAWRRLVTCQEIAHDIGLAHQDETFANTNLGSCMDYTDDPDGGAGGSSSNDPSNEHPNSHDFSQIASIYNHNDSFTTLAALWDAQVQALSVPQSIEEILADAGQWGTPVRWDSAGRPIVFVMPIPDHGGEHHGVNIVDVFWAPIPVEIDRPDIGEPGHEH